ncbi:MAG TPA: hypothetical protein VIH90_04245 [Candidatus Saccharimonadales bacterium]
MALAPETQLGIVSAEDLLTQYETASRIGQRIVNLDQDRGSLEAIILSNLVDTTIYEGLEGLPEQLAAPPEPELVDIAAMSRTAYEKLALSMRLGERLSEQETAVKARYMGKQVVVRAVDKSIRPIVAYYYPSGLDGGGQAEPRFVHGLRDKASGIVRNVLLKDNLLQISPRRLSPDRLDSGYYQTPVIDPESGEPLIDVEVKGLWAIGVGGISY